MKVNVSLTREKYPLSKNKILKKTIVSVLTTCLTLLFFVIFFSFPLIIIIVNNYQYKIISILDLIYKYILILPIFLLIYIFIVYLYQKAYFYSYYYEITDDYLIIKKGVFAPYEINIPWEKIQDVYLDQDIWDRIFDIFDIYVSTATISSGFSAHIDGVEKKAAYELKTILLEKIKNCINKNQTIQKPITYS